MFPLTKYAQHKLQQLAMEMRPVMRATHEKHILSKTELEEMGHAEAE